MPVSSPPPVDSASQGSLARPRGNGALAHALPAGMRDLLPGEARRQRDLTRALLESFARFGYELVSVPPFEYAEVLEHDMGPLDSGQFLRFVEPETGEVVALRPDMTPQIARLVATRLADAPAPLRLCYEGSVVRRRAERSRREREIHQAGIELMGLPGPEGDLEVLTVAASATRAAGLEDFTLDLGHAGIAGSLVATAREDERPLIVAALAAKDGEEARRRAEAAGISGRELAALVALPSLYGAEDVWPRARPSLEGTPAEGPARELENLHRAASAAGLAPRVVVDLGETWSFAYYTGMLFQILAEGPGEPIGSGGRYDRLFDRFGAGRPAAGFGIDLGNLGWALEQKGVVRGAPPRVLLAPSAPDADVFLGELRQRGIAAACGPSTDTEGYARAWRYSHIVELTNDAATLLELSTAAERRATVRGARDAARAIAGFISPKTSNDEGT